jgi:hypothetical protein
MNFDQTIVIEGRGQMSSIPVSFLGGPGFKSLPGNRYPLFVGYFRGFPQFLQPSDEMIYEIIL